MAKVELVMPKMGESIMEATILNWVKNVGDSVDEDETILEIATDKVDSEIPSPVKGVISQILRNVNDVVPVGEVIAILETEGDGPQVASTPAVKETSAPEPVAPVEKPEPAPVAAQPSPQEAASMPSNVVATASNQNGTAKLPSNSNGRFYSPLVRNIARTENIGTEELDTIPGTGANGRVTKKDILKYLEARTAGTNVLATAPSAISSASTTSQPVQQAPTNQPINTPVAPVSSGAQRGDDSNVEIIEMDRMRKMIADHMVMSKHTSPHVTSFVEADVTNLVNWRNSIKGDFQAKYGEKITFTPIFVEAVVKAIQDFPMVNVSVDGTNIIRKKNINIGMATALPSGNLIVPVIKNANGYNLVGLTQQVNGLANAARNNKLKPTDIQDGTFTVTNVGTFGNVMGTPIINQPQAAILALGAIRKKPAVLETEDGDVIAIRQMMFLSLSYDHRVVDGFLGGSFLRKVADYLESFEKERTI